MNDLLTEIETIVTSGTKVNINYYIDQVIDEDKKDEIYECLREAETDDINAILKELGEDEYSEEEGGSQHESDNQGARESNTGEDVDHW